MKRILVVLLSVMFSGSMLFGQNAEFDSRLLVKYTTEELHKINSENPAEIDYLTFCIEDAFYFGDAPESKNKPEEIDGEINIVDMERVNFYDLDIKIIKNNYQYFKITNTKRLLIVRSRDQILNKMKNQ